MLLETPTIVLLYTRIFLYGHRHSLQFTCGQNGKTVLTILELYAYDLECANLYRPDMDDDRIH